MGKFREPVWLSITVTDPVVGECFPHVWSTHSAGDLCDNIVYPREPVTICMHCFIEECTYVHDSMRCLLPRGHTPMVKHVNECNHSW